MSKAEETHQYEVELQLSKYDFYEDLSEIKQKLHETRIRLSPMRVIKKESLMISALGLLVGFVVGNRNWVRK
jgi:hypothetical protein